MSLGPDNTICTQQFIEGMRPIAGKNPHTNLDNVEDPQVKPNFSALGQAVYNIATQHAETSSNVSSDAAFWQWINDVENWLVALSQWQQAVAAAFVAWAPTQSPDTALKAAIQQAPNPGSPPTASPQSLKGKII